MMTDNQQATIGWVAGIFDSDGCFSIRMGHNRVFTPFASVTNTNKLIIEHLAEVLQTAGIGRHVSWKSNGAHNKPLGIVAVTGMNRLISLFGYVQPMIKAGQLGFLKEYIARRLSVPNNTRYDEIDEEFRQILKNEIQMEPQRLQAMLSEKSDSFLAGWLAGVIDGDGSLMILSGSTGPDGIKRLNIDAVVINSDINMANSVRWVVRKFGSDCTIVKKDNGAKATKPIYHTQTAGYKRTVPVLEIILPYLIGKREQAEILLELYHYRQTLPYRTPYGDYERELQRKVKSLNFRGAEKKI